MYSSPKVDPATGELMEVMGGGGRRIDYLLLREGDRTRLASFWFLTAIASLSDHLPVAMMVQRTEEEHSRKEQERKGSSSTLNDDRAFQEMNEDRQ